MLDSAVVDRRRRAAVAGHTGDLAEATKALGDAAPTVRSTALGALDRLGRLSDVELLHACGDRAFEVRRRACELGAKRPGLADHLVDRLGDEDDRVVEAACFALGELGGDLGASCGPAVVALSDVTRHHSDPLCREAAVAALGAIGDDNGLPAILAVASDRPAVRRRAVLALAPFDGPEVEMALARALEDRDWQVRQAAEDLSVT